MFKNKVTKIAFSPDKKSNLFIINISINSNTYDILSNDLLINDITKSKENLVFTFSDLNILKDILKIKLHYIINKKKNYLKSYLTISSNNPNNLILNHITFNKFYLKKSDKRWQRPNMEKAYIAKYYTKLGSPIYINSFFFGNEFPISDNNIENNISYLTYYQGRSLDKLNNKDNLYKSYNTIYGAGYGSCNNLIRKGFFKYLKDITNTPKLRIQYNSWFDHMLNISEEKIIKSFQEIEYGLSNAGIKPISSYVLDDGFSDYKKDFWNFNEKFPNELNNVTKLVKLLRSKLGLWLGPRGGYNKDTATFAKNMETSKKGGFNPESLDICIGDYNYLKNVRNLLLNYTTKFDLNYWKLDGFILQPCPSKNHGHATGGDNNMYSFTETWENWRKIFKDLKEKEIFINQTSYSNISPWHLDYANSLWMQNSHDMDFIDKTSNGIILSGSDADRMLTYRDFCYYDFFKIREYQIPSVFLYNHDPIYGNTANVKMDKENFRKYLFMQATRGNAFWELYYSYNMLDENYWDINSDVFLFLEKNFNILKNSMIFGGNPKEGNIYGFLAEENNSFIVSVRNPKNEKVSYTLKLNDSIGITNNFKNYTLSQIHPYKLINKNYSYNDNIKLELNPHDVFIFKFSNPSYIKKEEKLHLETIKDYKNKTELRFNRRVYLKDNFIILNGKKCLFNIKDNYRDIVIVEKLKEKNNIKLNIYDIYNRKYKINKTFYKKDLLFNSEFSLSFKLNNIKDNTLIYKDKITTINYRNSLFNFKIKKTILTEKTNPNDNIFIVRERNNLIKLYINGKLKKSILNPTKLNINLDTLNNSRFIKDLKFKNKSTIYNKTSN